MSTTRRSYYGFSIYHVIARGNNREQILNTVADKKVLLSGVRAYQLRLKFKIYAFVVMDNHFHILIGTSEVANISKIMQGILLSYSCRYRYKYDWVGHVWQGRFKSKPVISDPQMLENILYIHDNPLRAEMVDAAIEYPWSSAGFYDKAIPVGNVALIEVTKWGTLLP